MATEGFFDGLLDTYCARSDLGAPMFLNPKTGIRWSHGAARDTWAKAAEAVGVEIGFYEGTKHSRATGWLAAGVNERTIQEALGHRDVKSTQKYASLKPGALVELIAQARLYATKSQSCIQSVCSPKAGS